MQSATSYLRSHVSHPQHATRRSLLTARTRLARFYRAYEPTTYPILSSVLRLSTKYAIDGIRQEVIKSLSTRYPSSLAEFYRVRNREPQSRWLSPFPRIQDDHFHVLHLARQTSADVLLPVLYYEVSLLPLKVILSYASDPSFGGYFGDDLDTVLLGRSKIIHHWRDLLAFVDEPSPEDCQRKDICVAVKQMTAGSAAVWQMVSSAPVNLAHSPDVVLLPWQPLLCETCLKSFRHSFNERRRKLWEMLPSLFGLQPWESLKGS